MLAFDPSPRDRSPDQDFNPAHTGSHSRPGGRASRRAWLRCACTSSGRRHAGSPIRGINPRTNEESLAGLKVKGKQANQSCFFLYGPCAHLTVQCEFHVFVTLCTFELVLVSLCKELYMTYLHPVIINYLGSVFIYLTLIGLWTGLCLKMARCQCTR